MAYISLEHVVKRYKMGEVTITAVDDITFDIEKGEFVIIVGPSGAGKTTVLNILGGMDACDEGTILVDGKEISKCNSRQLTTYRRYDIGFVFQFYNLIQNLTALENVELAAQICKEPLPAQEVLCHVALAKNPKLLLCDEPTGALDYITGKAILKLLQDTCRQQGMTVVVITHNTEVLAYDGNKVYTCPIKARNLSGRTGRGDTTFAGYINERLTKDIPTALQTATALVSLKMETPGPFTGTRQDVEDYIKLMY